MTNAMIIENEVASDRLDLAQRRGRWAEEWAAAFLEIEGYAVWWINRNRESGADADIKADGYLYDVKSMSHLGHVANAGDHEPQHSLIVVASDYAATSRDEWWATATLAGVAPLYATCHADDVAGWKRCWHVHRDRLVPMVPPNLPLFMTGRYMPDEDDDSPAPVADRVSAEPAGSLFADDEIDVGSQVIRDKRTANPSRLVYGAGPDGATCAGCVHLVTAYAGKIRRCDVPLGRNPYGQHYAHWAACGRFQQ